MAASLRTPLDHMSKHNLRPPATTFTAPGITFQPDRFDLVAVRAIQAGVLDATGRAFLTDAAAVRFALGVASRVMSEGRLGEFQGPLCAFGGKNPALLDA